ncbi:hypothetical protein AGOR_G00084460 [Albula goreensis]|uniref:Uncharacterized protein n=1 Tax=Albula goreensis TaxID=1534307 RepID=A0A8T3DNZ1_9TELE|nr:hypothetical protein AGOR_G00084460 [Albula goreensis]
MNQMFNHCLLAEVSKISPTVAKALYGIDEAELLTLTPEDLSELLPGFGNFQNRKKIKNLIDEYLETPRKLWEQIWKISQSAHKILRDAGVDDAQLLALTRGEVNELLPGSENFQKRRKIRDLIYRFSEVQEQSAVLNNRNKQKDLHDKRSGQEEPTRGQEITRPKTMTSDQQTTTSSTVHHKEFGSVMHLAQPVKVHLIIHGNTLKMHEIFLNKLGLQTQVCGLEQCRVVLVFCPVASRKDTDINSASRMIPDNKDAILVK